MYCLTIATTDTTQDSLAEMQIERYCVELAFEDAKGECGLADYQVVGCRGLAPPRQHGDAGHAVHRRAAGGTSARPGVADTTRHRRDAEGDVATQAAG